MNKKKKKMGKKIKTFNVDAEIYNSLIEMFKKYDVNVSLSAYVNGCLKSFLNDLKELEEGLETATTNKGKFTVPMSFIINAIVTNKGAENDDYEEIKGMTAEDQRGARLLAELDEWQYDYDSQKKRIPVPFLRFLGIPEAYELSLDKKYLINKATGERFIAGKSRNTIIPVKER